MLSPELIQLAIIALASLSAGLIVYLLIFPYLSGEKAAEKRVGSVSERRSASSRARAAANDDLDRRRKQVQVSLEELEKRTKQQEVVTMRMRLTRAGLPDMSPQQFYMFSALGAVFMFAISYFSGLNLLISGAIAFVSGLGLPRWLLSTLAKRRQARFLGEFANTIDVVVRGVKSGLPLNECLDIISREAPEPIRTEFAELMRQQKVGVPLGECFERMYKRMPMPEVNFFAIVVAIQQQAGGNLAEALGNLADVLRARKMLAAKVSALSAEAKASAAILGALPFFVMGMTYMSSPEYISLLWNDRTGHMLLAGGGIWMTLGMLVMRKMINFDI